MSLEMIGIVLFVSLINSVVVGLLIETYVPKKRIANKILVDEEEIDMRRVTQIVRENNGK